MKQENDIDSETGQIVEASWNPFDPDFLINPYPQYELLRDNDPVHRTAFGPLVVTRFDYVSEVLRNPNTSADRDSAGRSDFERPEHIKKLQEASMDRHAEKPMFLKVSLRKYIVTLYKCLQESL